MDELQRDNEIYNMIYRIRSKQVMLDRDLALLFRAETKALNQAVKRNIERFPESYRFQLSNVEKNELVTNCDRFDSLKHSSTNPYAYTEHGVTMLSTLLKSQIAVDISIKIINAFVEMRHFISKNASVFNRLDLLELKQLENEQRFKKLFQVMKDPNVLPKQGIFFNGQIYDAYAFISDLIRSAHESLILIDNYIDDTVLTHFTKRGKDVKFMIFTKKISKQLKLDIETHNLQYTPVKIREFDKSHDRFLIIDNKDIYHIGASLKDLGKKWFAFTKLKFEPGIILNRITKDVE